MEKDYSNSDAMSRDIAFTRAIKAGKRMYYIDVKTARNGEYYLSLTESKKVVTGDDENPKLQFEKHKLFIYPEDFGKIMSALGEAVSYIEERQGKAEERPQPDDFSIDIEF